MEESPEEKEKEEKSIEESIEEELKSFKQQVKLFWAIPLGIECSKLLGGYNC